MLVERRATGGQAGQSSRIENYLGFPDGVSGAQLTDRARRQAAKFGAEILTAREVDGLEVTGASRTVRFTDGTQLTASRDGAPRGDGPDAVDDPVVGQKAATLLTDAVGESGARAVLRTLGPADTQGAAPRSDQSVQVMDCNSQCAGTGSCDMVCYASPWWCNWTDYGCGPLWLGPCSGVCAP